MSIRRSLNVFVRKMECSRKLSTISPRTLSSLLPAVAPCTWCWHKGAVATNNNCLQFPYSSRILELHRAHIPSAWDCVNCINLAKWMGLAMSSKLVSGDKPDVIAWPRRARSRTAIHGPHTIHGSEVDNRPVLSTRQAYAIFTNGKTVYLLCNLRGYFFKVGW